MSRKSRRAAMRAVIAQVRAEISQAREASTDERMIAITAASRMLRKAEVPAEWQGVEDLYQEFVEIAEADPDFPSEILNRVRHLRDAAEDVLKHKRRSDHLADQELLDLEDTLAIWKKQRKK